MARKLGKQCAIGGEVDTPPTKPTPDPVNNELQLIRSLVNCLHYYLNKDDSVMISQKKTAADIRRILSIYSRLDRDHHRQPATLFVQSLRNFILYSVAYLCYSNGIDDTKLVMWFLKLVHKAYGQFIMLFQETFPHPTKDSISSHPPTTSSNLPGIPHPFAYFVYHAAKSRLKFRRVRFLDLRLRHPNEYYPCPVYLASSMGEIDLLKHLLNMGASLGLDLFQNQSQLIKPPWVCSLIIKLLSNALRNGILNRPSTITENKSDDATSRKFRSGEKEIECLRLLLRAVLPLNIKWFDYRRNAYWKQVFFSAEDMIIKLSENGLLPKLQQRCLEPTELKHYCRISIREALRKNWQMPNGILELQIPRSLKQYLNLEDD